MVIAYTNFKIDSELNSDLRDLSDFETVLREAKNLAYASVGFGPDHRYFNNDFICKLFEI
jgi:hypothetical protein